MNNTFLKSLFRAGFILLFFCAASFSLQAQTIGTQATGLVPTAVLSDDYTITLKTFQQPVTATYEASVAQYEANMPDQATADTFMDQFERPYASIEVDQPSLTITLTLEMNSETSSWTETEWNEYLSN